MGRYDNNVILDTEMSTVTDKKMIETVISEKPLYVKKEEYIPMLSPKSRDKKRHKAAISI